MLPLTILPIVEKQKPEVVKLIPKIVTTQLVSE
jgi:hypothetical protein